MKMLRLEAERGILACGCHASTAGEILSQKRNFIASAAYKHHGRNLSFIERIVRKLPRTKFYRDTYSYLRGELEFIASASDKILRSMNWRRLNATKILTAQRVKFKRAPLSSGARNLMGKFNEL